MLQKSWGYAIMRFNLYLNPDLHFVNSGLLENPVHYVQVLILKSERHLSSDGQTVFYQCFPSHTCSSSILHLLLRNKSTKKASFKNIQKCLGQWKFILEKPHLSLPNTASGFQNEGSWSQSKQLQVRTAKLYLVENWHLLKACIELQE